LIWQTLCSMVWPSIWYPLPTTMISEVDWKGLPRSSTLNFFLLGAPSNHNFPGVFRHGPYAFLVLLSHEGLTTSLLDRWRSF
jgi:hypothetical protein